MANRHLSVLKRQRQNLKRRTRNRAVRTRVRTDIRRLREAVVRRDLPGAQAELRTAIREINKAASKGVLHTNTASRSIARLSRQVASLNTPGT